MNKEQLQILQTHIEEVSTGKKLGFPGMSYEDGMRDILELIKDGYIFDNGKDKYTQEFVQELK